LRRLEEGCIIVMDNASYHAVLHEKILSRKMKADVIAWLERKNIHHNPTESVSELCIVDKYKIRELDFIANEVGHDMIKLPPYHCQYNPIELIRAQIIRKVAEKNTIFKTADVKQLLDEAIGNVTVEDWEKCVKHAEKLQETDYCKSSMRDENGSQLKMRMKMTVVNK
jgi:transposase